MIVFRLEDLLKKRKWSAYKLAQESGIPQPTVYRLLSDRGNTDSRISLRMLDVLCDTLGCQVGDLLQHIPVAKAEREPKKRRGR